MQQGFGYFGKTYNLRKSCLFRTAMGLLAILLNNIKCLNFYPEKLPSYSTIRRQIKLVYFLNTLHNFNELARQLYFDN